jgi:alkylation response protein AidB-like acyl-CoA dehydrogenase
MTIRESVDLREDLPAQHETLRALLAGERSPAGLEAECGYHPGLHARLSAELGLPGWTIPAEFGGLGKSQVEACAIHTELGRALYPGPFLPSSVAAGALLATGHREACERWLPLLAGGTVAGTVAAADQAGHWAPGPGSVRADYGTGGWRLSGRRWYAVSADAADLIVIPAVTEYGLAMFLAETRFPDLVVARQLDLDLTRRISIVSFEAAPAELLTKDGAEALARAEREFLIATAAEAAGGIGWCLEQTLAHVREQAEADSLEFGHAAQLCVDMLTDMETISAAARYAAAATDIGAAGAQQAAHIAALQAGQTYRRVIDAAMSFADEEDGLLHYRRAWSAERLAGGPQAHRDALAAQLAKSRPAPVPPSARCRSTWLPGLGAARPAAPTALRSPSPTRRRPRAPTA